ncbi:hypothetical protein [Enterovirga rhinocerotis]|uniref:ElaB/YqjD/DUF883 family membrane-anchored ribosome-binding protein n=1 Tax=Enterovirga rhinocerotis TaxID=1339210 RepID=A0A4R7C5B6_9HYPH|nr:hypothetical protein [Enterovirga rhinocerotis]TDR93243.1 hypothetical protein EV668_0499 [Enterovirga rhinocerotis]
MVDRVRDWKDEPDAARSSSRQAEEKPVDLGSVADEVKSAAHDLKSAAVDQGRQFFQGAKDQATGFADRRKDEAAQSVSDIATGLRETGRSFGERPSIQAFVESAADGLDQLAGGLRERSFGDLYDEAEAYARRSPAVVGAVALAAGFLLARFIKSSADELSAGSAARRAVVAERRRRPAAKV